MITIARILQVPSQRPPRPVTRHAYGNYVVQHLLDHGDALQRHQLLQQLCAEAKRLARHKARVLGPFCRSLRFRGELGFMASDVAGWP